MLTASRGRVARRDAVPNFPSVEKPLRTTRVAPGDGPGPILTELRQGLMGIAAAVSVALAGVAIWQWSDAFRVDPIAATVLAGGMGLSVFAACLGCVLPGPRLAIVLSIPPTLLAAFAQIEGLAALGAGTRPTWLTAFCPVIVSTSVAGLVAVRAWSRHGKGRFAAAAREAAVPSDSGAPTPPPAPRPLLTLVTGSLREGAGRPNRTPDRRGLRAIRKTGDL